MRVLILRDDTGLAVVGPRNFIDDLLPYAGAVNAAGALDNSYPTIDRELLEAAEVDGANVVQRFRHVTLPGLRYVIVVVLLLSFMSTFNQFGLIFLMTGSGPSGATKLYSILAYEKAIRSLQYGPGMAIAFSVAPPMAGAGGLGLRRVAVEPLRDGVGEILLRPQDAREGLALGAPEFQRR